MIIWSVARGRELSIHGRTCGMQGEHCAEEPRGGGSFTQFRRRRSRRAETGKTARQFQARLTQPARRLAGEPPEALAEFSAAWIGRGQAGRLLAAIGGS